MRWRNVLAPAHGFTLPTPFADSINAASLVEIAAPSHGAQRLAAFYLASGSRPHPTAIIHHGFPGYEQNLDLAQTLRRGVKIRWRVAGQSIGPGRPFPALHACV